MEIHLDRYDDLSARGLIRQDGWGDGHKQACLMSALVTGATSEADCAAKGWPLWLAQMAVWLFDGYPENEAVARGRALATAIAAADGRGADWDRVFRDVRLDAILPIAMDAVGVGNEPWRVECRRAVQWSIDNDGQARAAGAAWSAGAALAARASGAAGAARAAEAARAAGAARAAEAAWAAGAARDRIEAALINALNSCK